MRFVIMFILLLLVTACSSTGSVDQATMDAMDADVVESAAPLSAAGLHRLEPLYPVEDARAGRDGCATVRYLLTPGHELQHVVVMDASTRSFGREAAAVIKRWDWSGLPAGTVSERTWFESRFEFCIESTAGKCDVERLKQNTQCKGLDVIPVVGYRVVRRF